VDESVFGNVTTMNEQQVFIDDLYDSLHKQQIQVEQIHAESAPGQLELVLEYQPSPLRMADWVLLAREAIAAVAKNHKLQAVFLPKVLQNQAGNGCHLHLSFANHPFITGQNLSWRAQSFLEGILRHLPSLLALTLPTGNSFRRVGAGCWTGSVVGWETEDKEAALRVCMDGLNVEYKLCDSTANLYLALSGLLACGLDGIAQNLALRPSLLSKQASGSKQDALPSSLHKSLECLQKDELLCGVMGPELSQAYIAVREVEAQMSAGIKLEEEVEVALGKI
jgi:glutamine synthetase